MKSRRDPVTEIIAFNRPLLAPPRRVPRADPGAAPAPNDLTAEALRRKLTAIVSTPFVFFRGTFHLMTDDLLKDRVPGAAAQAPDGLIVGDLHLENFGTYRGASGTLCFDVNDFDDVGYGPLDLDVKRLCVSAFLVPGLSRSAARAAAEAIAQSWASALERLGGRFPIPPWTEAKAEGWLSKLLRERGRVTQEQLIAKNVADKNRRRFIEGGEPAKYVHVDEAWARVGAASLDEYWTSLKELKAQPPGKGWEVLDVAYRFKGTGSLGRLRFSVLLGRGEERRIIEIKEARPSALDQARGLPEAAQRARVQTAAIRRIQGDPWPHVAGTHLGALLALGREIEPEEEKLSSDRFAAADDETGRTQLLVYARQCGEVLARLHCRASAPAMLAVDWSPGAAAEASVEFAERYAQTVAEDHAAFIAAQERVAREIGL